MKPRSRAPAFALLASLALLAAPPGLRGQAATPQPSQVEPVVTSLTIFAGTTETLWRTKDWGATWQPVGGLPSRAGLERLSQVRAIYPTGPRVYVGGAGGLCISDDFGVSWTRAAENETVRAILPSRYPQADPTVFLATSNGLLKTFDNGKTLVVTAVTGTPVHRIEWPGPALVLGTGRGVLVSLDSAQTVTGPGEGLPPGEVRALTLSAYYQVDPVIFAAVMGRGVYRSPDGGETWMAAGLTGREVNDLFWMGPVLYAATDSGVLKSEDLGASWVELNKGLRGKAQRLLFPLLPDSGAVVFVATDQGVFRSEDAGQSWRFAGMAGQDVVSIATFPAPERVLPPRRQRR